ncbi:MAG TPA: TetR/AcrR family transcriptional regulator [Acidimicrobiia bacterium]
MTTTQTGGTRECADAVERRPGRPRSTACDEAILRAALDEYAERGYEGMSVDAVAQRAGVGKATIYRRYQCKTDLVLAAASAVVFDDWEAPSGDDLRHDLRAMLVHLCGVFATTEGRAARRVVADSVSHPDLADAFHALVARRRAITRGMIERAVARGELSSDVDVDVVTDMLGGPVFYRIFISGDPIDDAYLDAVVRTALRAAAH